MIYSWYWYNRDAVVVRLPEIFGEMMENSFLRDGRMFRTSFTAISGAISRAENILIIQLDAIRRDPESVRRPSVRIPAGRASSC